MTGLGDAILDLFEGLAAEAGGIVDVSRGGNTAVQVTAIRGKSFTERFGTSDEFYGTSHQDDFIVKAVEYIAQVGGEPDTCDIIEWTDDRDVIRQFQVGVDGLERQYDPVDQFGVLYRVHTTEITAA